MLLDINIPSPYTPVRNWCLYLWTFFYSFLLYLIPQTHGFDKNAATSRIRWSAILLLRRPDPKRCIRLLKSPSRWISFICEIASSKSLYESSSVCIPWFSESPSICVSLSLVLSALLLFFLFVCPLKLSEWLSSTTRLKDCLLSRMITLCPSSINVFMVAIFTLKWIDLSWRIPVLSSTVERRRLKLFSLMCASAECVTISPGSPWNSQKWHLNKSVIEKATHVRSELPTNKGYHPYNFCVEICKNYIGNIKQNDIWKPVLQSTFQMIPWTMEY